jgi:ferredoxin
VPYEHGISLTGRQDVNLQIAVVACMRCTACQTNNKDCHQYPNDTEQSFSLKGIHAAAMPPSPAAAAIQAVAGCLPDGL